MANFQERLKQLRTEAGLTQNELAEKLQMSKGAIGNYESGQREPNMDTLDTIADFFNVELDYLRGRTNTRPELSLEEQWLVDCYRKTDDEIRTAVKSILRHFSEKPVEIKKPVRIIPLFPAAAGPEDLAEGEPFESYETDNDKADFAVRISGDSMEPHFKNGEVVLCQKRIPNDGDIAVMSVNGAIVVKQYISAFGNIYLRSLNRARKDMDIDILESGNYTVVGYGTVICAKIPLVTQ